MHTVDALAMHHIHKVVHSFNDTLHWNVQMTASLIKPHNNMKIIFSGTY